MESTELRALLMEEDTRLISDQFLFILFYNNSYVIFFLETLLLMEPELFHFYFCPLYQCFFSPSFNSIFR